MRCVPQLVCHTCIYVWNDFSATHFYVWHISCVTQRIYVWHIYYITHSLYHTFVCSIWICHVTHMHESCRTYEWVKSHVWMSHVTRVDEPCHTYGWAMSHIWMSHVTHMHESCHTHEWIMSHVWTGRITRTDAIIQINLAHLYTY